jgi:hypothetical protein
MMSLQPAGLAMSWLPHWFALHTATFWLPVQVSSFTQTGCVL